MLMLLLLMFRNHGCECLFFFFSATVCANTCGPHSLCQSTSSYSNSWSFSCVCQSGYSTPSAAPSPSNPCTSPGPTTVATSTSALGSGTPVTTTTTTTTTTKATTKALITTTTITTSTTTTLQSGSHRGCF